MLQRQVLQPSRVVLQRQVLPRALLQGQEVLRGGVGLRRYQGGPEVLSSRKGVRRRVLSQGQGLLPRQGELLPSDRSLLSTRRRRRARRMLQSKHRDAVRRWLLQ